MSMLAPPQNPSTSNLALAAATLALLVAGIYSPGLGGDFIFDDFANIVFNTRVHAETLDWESLVRAAGAYQGPIGRPLATIGFAVDYMIGGSSPYPFKIHSLLVHITNTALVFLLCRTLLGRSLNAPGWPAWGIFAVALTWAAHPIQVSSVLYVVQRMEMLATLFVLVGLILYVKARLKQIDGHRATRLLIISCIVPAAGLLSKENAVLYPLYYLALELTFFRFRTDSQVAERQLKLAYLVVLATGALAFVVLIIPRFAAPDVFLIRNFDLEGRLLTQLRVLPMYLGQIVLPSPSSLTFYYDDLTPSSGILAPPQTLIGGLFLCALLYSAWHFRARMQAYSLGVFWFFAAHALTSGPVNLELAFEHRNYFASFGAILALAGLGQRFGQKLNSSFQIAATFAFVALISIICMIRSATWGDPLVLAMDMVAANPRSARASNDLAATYARYATGDPDSPFIDLAIKEFERGAALPGSSPLAEQGLILTSTMAGRPVEPAWWESLINKLRTQPIGPEQHMAVTGILNQHYQGFQVDAERLAEAYEVLLERMANPPALMYATLADLVATDIGDVDRARRLYKKAIFASNKDPAFASHLLATLIAEDRADYAEAVTEEMARLGMISSTEHYEPDAQSK